MVSSLVIAVEKAFWRLNVHIQLKTTLLHVNSKTCNYLTDTGYLNRKHRYYTQIQGQLLAIGQLFCDFYLDSIKLQTRTNIS